MSKGPDLSAFPIPRKGGAKPIAMDEASKAASAEEHRAGEGSDVADYQSRPHAAINPPRQLTPQPSKSVTPHAGRTDAAVAPATSGQTVATTVKLDENHYLRLAEAGKPGPGRLKRRTIQEMMVEALDEWFERRGL